MAEAVHGPALHEIEIALAASRPTDSEPSPRDEHHRRARGDVHQRVERMGSARSCRTPLVRWGEKAGRNARRPHFAGAAFSKTWLKLVDQRCRRTRRDPSSSNERRRQAGAADGPVQFHGAGPYSRMAGRLSSGDVGFRTRRRCRAGRIRSARSIFAVTISPTFSGRRLVTIDRAVDLRRVGL